MSEWSTAALNRQQRESPSVATPCLNLQPGTVPEEQQELETVHTKEELAGKSPTTPANEPSGSDRASRDERRSALSPPDASGFKTGASPLRQQTRAIPEGAIRHRNRVNAGAGKLDPPIRMARLALRRQTRNSPEWVQNADFEPIRHPETPSRGRTWSVRLEWEHDSDIADRNTQGQGFRAPRVQSPQAAPETLRQC